MPELPIESLKLPFIVIFRGGIRIFAKKIMERIIAGGRRLIVAEKNHIAIRVYTNTKLNTYEMRDVIRDLMERFDTILFATVAKHKRGDEYASWTSGIFCNFDTHEILNMDTFMKL